MTDDWMDELREWAQGVRPVGDQVAPVRDAVRRRRRRRGALVAGGAAVLVAVTSVGIATLPGATSERGGAPRPAASSGGPVTSGFSCGDNPVFGDPPPIPDRETQELLVERLEMLSSVQVRYAEPTALGVVAMVVGVTADVEAQLRSLGVARVQEWDPTMAEAGLDASGQVRQVLDQSLTQTYREVRRATRGIPGRAEPAYWAEAGAIRVAWKAPVPAAVAALAGPRPDGTRVVVDAVAYSEREVQRAQRVVAERFDQDRLSSAGGCGDGSGLRVGVRPPIGDREALEAELSDLVGMPVRVVPEDVVVWGESVGVEQPAR